LEEREDLGVSVMSHDVAVPSSTSLRRPILCSAIFEGKEPNQNYSTESICLKEIGCSSCTSVIYLLHRMVKKYLYKI